MGALLLDEWLADAPAIAVIDAASVSQVREAVRAAGPAAGLDLDATESLAGAASELAHNQLAHAGGGRVAVRAVTRAGVSGVEVVAADRGPGIAEPRLALEGSGERAGGLGLGLGAAYRMADEVDFDVRAGQGTCVWARKFAAALPRSEVAILSRPCQDEVVNGDHAGFLRLGDQLVLAVADGLGHGPPARDAADRVIGWMYGHPQGAPAELLLGCEPMLGPTRGAAASVARLDLPSGELRQSGAGNVAVQLYQAGGNVRFSSTARVLGRPPPIRLREETAALAPTHLVLVFSDGLSSRLDLSEDAALRRQPPLVIAHELMRRHGQLHDDCTILVERLG